MSTLIQITKPTELIVNNTPIIGGVDGRVLFQGTGNVLQQSSSLFWDSTNNRLGIGTSSPTFRLEVQGGDVRFANGLTIGTAGSAGWQFSSNTVTLIQNGFVSVDFANGREFSFTNASFSTTYLKLASVTGNVLINTTTDAGFKLDVNGTARVSGQFTASSVINVVSGSTTLDRDGVFLRMHGTSGIKLTTWNAGYVDALTVQATTGNVGIGTTSPSTLLHVAGNITIGGASATTVSSTYNSTTRNQIRYTNGSSFEFHEGVSERVRLAPASGNVLINTTTDAGFKLDVNGTARIGNTDGIKFTPGNNSSITFMQAVDRISLTRLNSDKLQITAAGTNTIIGNGISTNASAHTWLLEGEITSAVTMDTTKYVKVFINGVAYKLAICV
jgi:hypothetical protein